MASKVTQTIFTKASLLKEEETMDFGDYMARKGLRLMLSLLAASVVGMVRLAAWAARKTASCVAGVRGTTDVASQGRSRRIGGGRA